MEFYKVKLHIFHRAMRRERNNNIPLERGTDADAGGAHQLLVRRRRIRQLSRARSLAHGAFPTEATEGRAREGRKEVSTKGRSRSCSVLVRIRGRNGGADAVVAEWRREKLTARVSSEEGSRRGRRSIYL